MSPTSETIDKVIVTNVAALTGKYGDAGVQEIKAAIQTLVEADKQRGLATQFFALDDAATMQQFNGEAVTKPTDPKQNKAAVDALYQALTPDYILILGAPDVIPHQDLANPAYSGNGQDDDNDKYAYGDLPYACEDQYDRDIDTFLGPTRVVGRLPDITGGNDVQYLLNLLKIAANYTQREAELYYPYFGISAQTWEDSTALSLSKTFRHKKDLKTVPPEDEDWPSPLLGNLSHFINCHGSLNDSRFFGESVSEDDTPPSLDAKNLAGHISEGTVVSAECCYGGQLFDPSLNNGQVGIANAYLANKAYGFFGSTTIAYGLEEGNDAADLICQYFLQRVLQGDSLGQAALEARQSFIKRADTDDLDNLKTIAQFNLYADPSIKPVTPPPGTIHLSAEPSETPETPPPGPGTPLESKVASPRVERKQRRLYSYSLGLDLKKIQPTISKVMGKIDQMIHDALQKVAAAQGFIPKKILTFKVDIPKSPKDLFANIPKSPMELFAKKSFCDHVHMIFGATKKMPPKSTGAMGTTTKQVPKVVRIEALIAKEVDGKIVSVKKIVSR